MSRKMQHLLPLAVLVPYCAYVISTTFSDHDDRRAENDRKRKDTRAANIASAIEKAEPKK